MDELANDDGHELKVPAHANGSGHSLLHAEQDEPEFDEEDDDDLYAGDLTVQELDVDPDVHSTDSLLSIVSKTSSKRGFEEVDDDDYGLELEEGEHVGQKAVGDLSPGMSLWYHVHCGLFADVRCRRLCRLEARSRSVMDSATCAIASVRERCSLAVQVPRRHPPWTILHRAYSNASPDILVPAALTSSARLLFPHLQVSDFPGFSTSTSSGDMVVAFVRFIPSSLSIALPRFGFNSNSSLSRKIARLSIACINVSHSLYQFLVVRRVGGVAWWDWVAIVDGRACDATDSSFIALTPPHMGSMS